MAPQRLLSRAPIPTSNLCRPAAGAVTRLVDMGVEPSLISSPLEAVLAHRLLRKVCRDCRVEWPLWSLLKDKLRGVGSGSLVGPFYHGTGCEECRGTGYRGRTGIFELLPISPELRQIIVQRRSSAEVRSAAQTHMVTLQQDALRKAAEGLTTLDEVVRVTSPDLKE